MVKQLIVIQSALRNAPVLHSVVKELTRDQMLAVAAYLEWIWVSGDRRQPMYIEPVEKPTSRA